MHKHTHTHHTHAHKRKYTHTHTYAHTYTQMYIHTHRRTPRYQLHAHIHTRVHVHTQAKGTLPLACTHSHRCTTPEKILGRGFWTPYSLFRLFGTINYELNYSPLFTNLSEPGSISAGFQWTGSIPARFQEDFRAVYNTQTDATSPLPFSHTRM